MIHLSKTQIDKLGERLKQVQVTDEDLRMLDEYRKTFSDAYAFVVHNIRQHLNIDPTGRPAKSTPAIIDKLRRESTRLTQIQDIAGCRIVVADLREQDQLVAAMRSLFTDLIVIDRRVKPSHGYRAVHIVIKHQEKVVEVQIRTNSQHGWAELSEKMADTLDPSLKYGGGNKALVKLLGDMSSYVARSEDVLAKRIVLGTMATEEEMEAFNSEAASLIVEGRELAEKFERTLDSARTKKKGLE